MAKLALRGLMARRLRALLTTVAVLIGVALIAGTYVLTDTINHAFDELFKLSYRTTDVVVTPRERVKQQDREPPPFPAAYLGRVRRVPGVADAAGSVFSYSGRLVDRGGEQLGAQLSPAIVSSTVRKPFNPLSYVKGRPPRTADEVALDNPSARREGIELGDRIGVAAERPVRFYRVVGISKLGNASFGGTTFAELTFPEAVRITDRGGHLNELYVRAEDDVGPGELRNRIAAALPGDVRVETADESAARQSKEIASDLGFLRTALLVFAGVSLFVGAFLIFNTFSITVAQRVREFGMLRTLGASRRQVLSSVLLEALAVGLVGSLLGLAGGVGLAKAINALFEGIGIDLPTTGAVIATRTVIVSLLVGLVVTALAALVPAWRATRVSPIEALTQAEIEGGAAQRTLVTAVALGLTALGAALTCIGLFAGIDDSGAAAGLLGGGAAIVLLGVSLLSPRLVRPLASVAGWPLERLRGLTGRLARENALRKPGRTATTAAALMIGLAVVVFVTVFAAGIKGSVDKAIDRNFQGDLVVQHTDGFSPIPNAVAAALRRVDGVGTVSTLRFSAANVRGVSGDRRVSGVDPRSFGRVASLDWQEGSPATLRRLGDRGAIVDDAWASSHGFDVGSRIRAFTPTGRHVSFVVRGTVEDNADLLGDFTITQAALAADFGATLDSLAFVKVAPGASPSAVRRRVDQAIGRAFPTADVLNQQQLKDRQARQVNQLLGLIYALLSLAVIVSLFGIVNTLGLSIYERTRELGMLRAVGMSRRQVRTMIRYEAVITALIGALLGTVLGVVFAALVSRPLADEGFTLSYPIGTLLALLVLAAFAGVVAAIGPARRAARLDVLRALAYE
ncbi:MAG: ABC transporter permease [Nocardioidaceae bacterium]